MTFSLVENLYHGLCMKRGLSFCENRPIKRSIPDLLKEKGINKLYKKYNTGQNV